MHRSILSSLALLPLSLLASPLAQLSATPEPTAEAACRNPDLHQQIDPTCWETLEMGAWMQTWNTSTKICKPQEAWGDCFTRLTHPDSRGATCSSIDVASCPEPKLGQIVQGPAEIFYGAYAVWYFNGYMQALYSVPGGLDTAPLVAFESTDTNGIALQDPHTAKLVEPLLDAAGADHVPGGLAIVEVLANVLTDFAGGDFLKLADGGGLLRTPVNANVETLP